MGRHEALRADVNGTERPILGGVIGRVVAGERSWPVLLAVGLLLPVAGCSLWPRARHPQTPSQPVQPVRSVDALGRLVPEGEVRQLAGPVSNGRFNARVEQVLVAEGQAVRRGQVLVVMDSHAPLVAQEQRLMHQVAQLREQLRVRRRLSATSRSPHGRPIPSLIWSSSACV